MVICQTEKTILTCPFVCFGSQKCDIPKYIWSDITIRLKKHYTWCCCFVVVACHVCNLRSSNSSIVCIQWKSVTELAAQNTSCEIISARAGCPDCNCTYVCDAQGVWAGGTGWAVSMLGEPQEADHHSLPDHHPHVPRDHKWPARIQRLEPQTHHC